MSEIAIEKKAGGGVVEIRSADDNVGKLEVYIRHPMLAEVIRKMTPGNYVRTEYDKVYQSILLAHPESKTHVVTRPAIYVATKNFGKGVDFSWDQPPRGILLCNPDKLAEGYCLAVDIKTPVPPETLRRWGKQFVEGCNDIIAASRPFKMTWVMTEVKK